VSPDPTDMEYIYVITGFLTIAFAIAGLVLTCYLERRWLNSRRTRPDKNPSSRLSADGLST
jgi:hypothetical protein